MVFKFKKIVLLLLFSIIIIGLAGCPSEEFCDPEDQTAAKIDLITIKPEERVLKIGDTLLIEIIIPSKMTTVTGNSFDIRKTLNLDSSFRSFNISELLEGNDFEVLKGFLENNQVVLNYFEMSDTYIFECAIFLKQTGVYSQFGSQESISFSESNRGCNYFRILTNIKGINEEGFYEFSVEE